MSEAIIVNGVGRRMRVLVRGLIWIVALLAVVGVAGRWDRIGTVDDVRWRIVLTVVGLLVGAWMGGIWAGAGERFKKTAGVSGVAILFSEVCYLIVVWTSWKMHPMVWRC